MRRTLLMVVLALSILIVGCQTVQNVKDTTTQGSTNVPVAAKYAGKKILWIDSYHEGYAWSDGIAKGIKTVLEGTGAELKIHRMDTKNNPAEEFKVQAGEKAMQEIEAFKPDVVIISDDNSVKYVLVKYYMNSKIPFVFNGLNWDSKLYNLDRSHITGMEEVAALPQMLEQVKPYAKGDRLGFIGTDTETSRKEASFPSRIFNLAMEERYAPTFDDWKSQVLELQDKVDILYLENNAGIKGWNDEEAKTFIQQNIKIPTMGIYDWLKEENMITYAKRPEEQGEWSATAALEILDGKSPADIPIAQNKQGMLILNKKLADKLGVTFRPELIKNAAEIVE